SHRDDPVEGSREIAVVLKPELHPIGKSFVARTHLSQRILLLGQGDARDARRAILRKIQRQPAPAAADVEHALVLPNKKLGGEVAFFGKLCVIERLIATLEISAAILKVGIEKKRIKLSIEIVMVSNISPSTRAHVQLRQST